MLPAQPPSASASRVVGRTGQMRAIMPIRLGGEINDRNGVASCAIAD